jgi:hypothetical protein
LKIKIKKEVAEEGEDTADTEDVSLKKVEFVCKICDVVTSSKSNHQRHLVPIL